MEQELREKIESILAYSVPTENRKDWAKFASKEVLALIKEALPELAKEAGYVKLAEDQSLPGSWYSAGEHSGMLNLLFSNPGILILIGAGWRKVERAKPKERGE